MTLTTAVPSAGWFPDPGDPAQERWWSGEAWTAHHRAMADAPTSPPTAVDEHPVEPAQPAYVFDMTAPAAATYTTPDVRTSAPARPTLPTFEELLAAAAAPHPDEFEDAPAPEPEFAVPAFEPLQKSYGAPASDAVPAAETAPAEVPRAPVLPEEPAAVAAVLPSAPVLAAQQEFTPQPVATPQPDTSASAAPQPLAVPLDAGFVLPPQQPQPSMPGLVMPSATTSEPTTPRAELSARHADPLGVLPPMPASPPAPAPVGYTASADITVANRYRAALHAPEPELVEEPNPYATALGPYPAGGGVPAPAGSPSQPGWQGMPLPAPGAAFSPSAPAAGGYAAPTARPEGHNKTAWTALGSGGLALGLAIFFLFFDRIGLWPALLAIAAVVQGIVGAVHSRKVGTGLGPALAAIGVGLVALGIMVTSVVSWTLFPEFVIEGQVIEQDIVAYASDYGVDAVSADCPDEMSGSAGAKFDCTAYDAEGTSYPVAVTVDEEGYFNWTITAADANATANA